MCRVVVVYRVGLVIKRGRRVRILFLAYFSLSFPFLYLLFSTRICTLLGFLGGIWYSVSAASIETFVPVRA